MRIAWHRVAQQIINEKKVREGRGWMSCEERVTESRSVHVCWRQDQNMMKINSLWKTPQGYLSPLFLIICSIWGLLSTPPLPISRRCFTSHNPTRQICHNLCSKRENLKRCSGGRRLCRQERQWTGDHCTHTKLIDKTFLLDLQYMLGVRKWPLLWVVAASEIDFTFQINRIADLTFMQFKECS